MITGGAAPRYESSLTTGREFCESLYFVKSDLLLCSFLVRAAAASKVKLELEPLELLLGFEIPLEPDEYLLPELPL